MNLKDKRVLVTGAGGFIGSHLAARLMLEGCHVRALIHYDSRADRSNLEFLASDLLREIEVVAGDICDPSYVNKAVRGCDIVFHLAALVGIPYSYAAPASYVQTNVMGTLHVLEACQANNVERVVHTSTSEAYGTAQYTPIDEKHPLRAQSPYAATKIAADKLAESFHLSFSMPVTTIRPFNTFGPRQSARAVIPTILQQLLAGCLELKLGALDPIRDLNYVDNTVEGFLAVAKSEAAIGRVLNFGSGRGISVQDVAEMAMKVSGRNVPIRCEQVRVRPASSEVFTLICDNRLAFELTGWRPKIDLEAGLQRTAQFIEKNLNFYRPEKFTR